jgi:NTE family protein
VNVRFRPDVLVLGVGGVLGEAWMSGLLAGLEDGSGFDLRTCDYFVGTSAGSIVASALAGGDRLERPVQPTPAPARAGGGAAAVGLAAAALHATRRAGDLALGLGSAVAPLALELAAPGGAIMRGALLRVRPRASDTLAALRSRIDRSHVSFDGRLRIVAVGRRSGRRTVFGAPGAPPATVGQAVEASCAVPSLYAPAVIDGLEYVDGGVWSPTNLDIAPAGRDTEVLCLIPTAGLVGNDGRSRLIRNVTRSAASVEALVLRRRGASVRIVTPGPETATLMGADLMDPTRRDAVLAAGYRQGILLDGLDDSL